MNSAYQLFSTPSFTEGIARLFDFGGTLNTYNESKSEAEADSRALFSDWCKVGNDLSEAILEYEQQESK